MEQILKRLKNHILLRTAKGLEVTVFKIRRLCHIGNTTLGNTFLKSTTKYGDFDQIKKHDQEKKKDFYKDTNEAAREQGCLQEPKT